jgi:hypothetical protein
MADVFPLRAGSGIARTVTLVTWTKPTRPYVNGTETPQSFTGSKTMSGNRTITIATALAAIVPASVTIAFFGGLTMIAMTSFSVVQVPY